YRWSGSQAWLMVGPANSASKKVTIRARGLPGLHGEALPVRWSLGGRDAGVRLLDANWRDYSFDLPAGASRDGLVVELSAHARRPSAEDPRALAVAVDSISTEQ